MFLSFFFFLLCFPTFFDVWIIYSPTNCKLWNIINAFLFCLPWYIFLGTLLSWIRYYIIAIYILIFNIHSNSKLRIGMKLTLLFGTFTMNCAQLFVFDLKKILRNYAGSSFCCHMAPELPQGNPNQNFKHRDNIDIDYRTGIIAIKRLYVDDLSSIQLHHFQWLPRHFKVRFPEQQWVREHSFK